MGIALYVYEDSPFEKMAYNLQLEFEHGIYRRSLVQVMKDGPMSFCRTHCLEAASLPQSFRND